MGQSQAMNCDNSAASQSLPRREFLGAALTGGLILTAPWAQRLLEKDRFSTPARLPVFPNNELPGLRKLSDMHLGDTSICLGGDGLWYMTGTTQPDWHTKEPIHGVNVWRSADMLDWKHLGEVFHYGESPWHKPYLETRMPIWAPEIHYLKGTFWLTYSMPGWDNTPRTSACGLAKSTSAKAGGPYIDMHPDGRLGDEIDASLFEDDDGTVYFLWHSGKIARMTDDMSALAEPYHWIHTSGSDRNPSHHSGLCAGIFGKDDFNHIGFEGAYLFKANGRYYFSCAEEWEGRYSCSTAIAKNIYGPYSERYESIPHAGHNVFFQDELSKWWSTFFGADAAAPWQRKPGVVPIYFDEAGRIRPSER